MFSFSQLNQWDKCRYAWHLTYNENLMLGGPKSRPLSFGSLTHECLADTYHTPETIENYNDSKLDDEPTIFKVGHRQVLLDYLNAGGDQQTIVDVGRLMDKYINDYAPFNDRGWKPLAVEQHFELELVTPRGRKFILQGYVDLVIELQGKIIVVEHKTYNSRPWSPNEIQMDIQTTLYCMALEKIYDKPINTAIYNFLNSYPYKSLPTEPVDKIFKRVSVFRSPVEQKFVINEIGRTVDEILDAEQQHGSGPIGNRFDAYKKSLGKACSMCQFQQICLAEMKGIDTAGIKKSLYVERTPVVINGDGAEDQDN